MSNTNQSKEEGSFSGGADERERFESWVREQYGPDDWFATRIGNSYKSETIADHWMAWQARAALTADRWIPVAQRLPAPDQMVLLMSQSWIYPSIVRYTPDYLGAGPKFVETYRGAEMTYWYPERMHWTPLPAPPALSSQSEAR